MGRIATLLLASATACAGERAERQTRESTRVEAAIEHALGERVGTRLLVRCVWLPPRCRAYLPDGGELDVRMFAASGQLVWGLDGALVVADDIEAYLRETLAEMGVPQVARCGVRIRTVAAGDRVECALQNGGRAFVVANDDATTTIEIVLDPAAGVARTELVRDEELQQMSEKLEHADDEADDD